jgi:methyl-accepting chemotaxis protein
MQTGSGGWVQITFTIVAALALLLQAGILLGMLIMARVVMKRGEELSRKAEEHALPALQTARHLLEDVTPKLKVAVQNMVEVTETLRTKSVTVTDAVDDLVKRAEIQVDRVDEMVTGTLNSISNATATVQKAVVTPVRQVSAVLSGLRAGFDVLRSKEQEVHASADGDHFV